MFFSIFTLFYVLFLLSFALTLILVATYHKVNTILLHACLGLKPDDAYDTRLVIQAALPQQEVCYLDWEGVADVVRLLMTVWTYPKTSAVHVCVSDTLNTKTTS